MYRFPVSSKLSSLPINMISYPLLPYTAFAMLYHVPETLSAMDNFHSPIAMDYEPTASPTPSPGEQASIKRIHTHYKHIQQPH